MSASVQQYKPGEIIDDRYRVVRVLGKGGMGIVYQVHELATDRHVALKTINASAHSQAALDRFVREIRLAARLDHPNIVKALTCATTTSGAPYFTMELIEGRNLHETIRQNGPMRPQDALTTLIPIARALAHAHDQDIIHRDVKPANIIFDPNNTGVPPKLLDFGTAKLFMDEAGQSLTKTGMLMGSPDYLSPEQAAGRRVDNRTDIYAFGATLWECLIGHPPYQGASMIEVIVAHTEQDVPSIDVAMIQSLSRNTVDKKMLAALDTVIANCMAKAREDRYQDMHQLLVDLDKVISIARGAKSIKIEPRILTRSFANQSLSYDASSALEAMKDKDADSMSISPDFVKSASQKKMLIISSIAAILLVSMVGLTVAILNFKPRPQTITADPHKSTPETRVYTPVALDDLTTAQKYCRTLPDGRVSIEFPPLTKTDPPCQYGVVEGPDHVLHPAIGTVIAPQGGLIFRASKHIMERPDVFYRLPSRAIAKLSIQDLYRFSDEQFAYCGPLQNLDSLEIKSVAVSNKSLDHIGKLDRLAFLCITDAEIDGEALSHIPNILKLKQIYLRSMPHTDAVIKQLAQSNQIVELSLLECNLTDIDIPHIARMANLHKLSLSHNLGLTQKGLEPLVALKKLRQLSLTNNPISPDIIDLLKRFPSLKSLHLSRYTWNADKQKSFEKECARHGISVEWRI